MKNNKLIPLLLKLLFSISILISCFSCDGIVLPEEPTDWDRFKAIFDIQKVKSEIDSTRIFPTEEEIPRFNFQDLFAKLNGIDTSIIHGLSSQEDWIFQRDSLNENWVVQTDSLDIIQDKKYKIFGWHPSWLGDAYKSYNYDLLSFVSWFSYDVDANTGGYDNPEIIDLLKQNGPELIELAHEKGCKALLTITNHTPAKNRVFLTNNANQQEVLIDSLLSLLLTLNLDGIDVNFELIPSGYGKQMISFLGALSSRLKAVNPDYIFCVTIPKVNGGRYPNLSSLNSKVDYFLLTGYDFYTGGSSRDGPIAPLRAVQSKLSIQTVVNKYLDSGILPEQLILGLPYYGGMWESNNSQRNSRDRNFLGHMTYRYIMARYGDKMDIQYDTLSQSAYLIYPVDGNRFEKIWFDDATTLKIKYDWAKKKQLGGIGIWALGYDNGRQELWDNIQQSFVKNTYTNKQISFEPNLLFKIVAMLTNYETPLLLMFSFLSFFCGLGFIISLFDWRVRDYLFDTQKSRLMTALFSIGAVLTIYALIFGIRSKNYLTQEWNSLLIGMLIGALITSLVFWWANKRSKYLS